MRKQGEDGPDGTAVRVALWRALHLEVDQPPFVLQDGLGLKLAAPPEGWRRRPDMDPEGTRPFRASILSRARYIEDLALQSAAAGLGQFVLLGAGLDTFAQRRAGAVPGLTVFEADRAATQAWKKRRLLEEGLGLPDRLRFVPLDFEEGEDWMEKLAAAGLDRERPALVSSTGVSLYLTRAAVEDTLRRLSTLAPGSTLVMTFIQPMDLVDPAERPVLEAVEDRARASGTPFLSHFAPGDIRGLALKAGFKRAGHVPAEEMDRRYFTGRKDKLRQSSGELLLVAET